MQSRHFRKSPISQALRQVLDAEAAARQIIASRPSSRPVMERSIMGVAIPIVELIPPESGIQYGPIETRASLDRALRAFQALQEIVAQFAETETTNWRLAREIRKAQRRVNTLSAIFKPRYETMIAEIEATLEEKERDAGLTAEQVLREGAPYDQILAEAARRQAALIVMG